MEYLVFSSDGVLRAKLGDNNPALPLFFLKSQSKHSELRFMSYWLSQTVIFEEGLTIGSFLTNLEPFQDYLNEYLGKDISAYIKESKKLISIDQRKNFDWITLFHNYTICEKNEFNENKEQLLTNQWKIYENYSIAAYNHNDNEHYAVEKYAIQKIQHIPLFLDKNTRIIINEKEIENIDQSQTLLNEQAFGVIQQEVAKDYHLKYLLSQKKHTLTEVIEGFFKYFKDNISSRENEIEMLEDFIENLEENTTENDINLKIHGGYLQKAITEMEDKEKQWNNLVHKAVQENTLVKIGKITEGLVPEEKLYGTTIKENVKRIKLK